MPPKSSTVLQEHKRPKPQRTLKRLLTDEKRASRRPTQGLTRSTTDSALMGIKRESSDVSLSKIHVAKGRSQIPKQYSQREVDLAAASKATEAKLQRKRAFEQDLKGAIAALRRPNPRLAVKDFVDSADRRASVTGSRSRSSLSSLPTVMLPANATQNRRIRSETLLLRMSKSWQRLTPPERGMSSKIYYAHCTFVMIARTTSASVYRLQVIFAYPHLLDDRKHPPSCQDLNSQSQHQPYHHSGDNTKRK